MILYIISLLYRLDHQKFNPQLRSPGQWPSIQTFEPASMKKSVGNPSPRSWHQWSMKLTLPETNSKQKHLKIHSWKTFILGRRLILRGELIVRFREGNCGKIGCIIYSCVIPIPFWKTQILINMFHMQMLIQKNTISMVESCQTWDERTHSHLVSKNMGLLQIWSTRIPLVSKKKQTSQYENLPNVGFSSDIQTAAANLCQVGYSTYNIYVCASFFGVWRGPTSDCTSNNSDSGVLFGGFKIGKNRESVVFP